MTVPVADNKATLGTDHVTSMIVFHEHCIRMIRT